MARALRARSPAAAGSAELHEIDGEPLEAAQNSGKAGGITPCTTSVSSSGTGLCCECGFDPSDITPAEPPCCVRRDVAVWAAGEATAPALASERGGTCGRVEDCTLGSRGSDVIDGDARVSARPGALKERRGVGLSNAELPKVARAA